MGRNESEGDLKAFCCRGQFWESEGCVALSEVDQEDGHLGVGGLGDWKNRFSIWLECSSIY